MATKIVKKELMNDEIKEFGEDAAIAINELLGLYGLNDENKRNEFNAKFYKSVNSKKISNISQKLMEQKRCSEGSDNESMRILKLNDYSSVSSDKDNSSRENSKSPMILKANEKQDNLCSWCHQSICSHSSNEVIGSGGAVFCSENCFLFWRRASFKRAKTCDFCKNVRNAVSYVDFNDGTTQLQFCSDKCLNQYKMQIFCHETQAHLELNPHLKDKNKNDSSESLITPDLWLKNCRTRSPSPEQYSKSPSPMTIAEEKAALPKIIVTQQALPSSSTQITSTVANLTHSDNAIDTGKKKPMINVLPSSKLLSRNMLHHRNLRKRRTSSARLAMSNKGNQNSNGNNSGSERIMNTNFPADLRAKIHSQMNNSSKPIQTTSFNRPPPQQFMQRPPINLFKFRLPFPMSTLQQQQQSPQQQQQQQQQRMPQYQQQPPLPPLPPPEDSNLNPLSSLNSLLPPSVVLVPYPIPLPIILPIPLPITAFIKAYQSKESELSSNGNDNESREEIRTMPACEKKQQQSKMYGENDEQPLDLSSEQGTCDDDKHSLNHHHKKDDDDIDENDTTDSYEKADKNDEMPKYELTKINVEANQSKDSSENNRPLRKRKIIATDVDEGH